MPYKITLSGTISCGFYCMCKDNCTLDVIDHDDIIKVIIC